MSDPNTTHPAPDQLAAFGRGVLADTDCATVEQHLAGCATCQRALETLPDDPLIALVRGAAASAGAAPARPRLQLGYEILEEIGHGGMGVVYKARQAGLNRFVALKKIHAGADARPEALARFRREAEAVARLAHPHIVQVYEVAEQDGQPYLALEYVAGGSLADRLTAPLPPRAAAELVETLARALDHAHQRGIVHRDLKPANILLSFSRDPQGSAAEALPCGSRLNELVPKISDFGLAKDLTRGPGQTQTGAIVGTPAYMAPEQAAGQGGQVGPPADIHALGAILYECLTGRPPFQGATVLETVEQVRTQEPVPPGRLQPKVPRDLETVCLKCLRKEPQKRYASAQELAADLRRFLAGEPIQARPVSRPERAWRWARRRPAAAGLLALSGLAVAAFVAGLWWHTTRLSAQVQKARQQQDRADTNYRQARRAINQMLDRLNQFQAPGVPQIETLRRDLSQDALTFFEGIAGAEADADPATRLDFARAYLLMGKLLSGQGQPEVRRAKLERARRLLEQLAAEDPANRDYQIGLADCLEELAKGAGGEECLRFREEALAVSQELCRLEPDNARWQRAVAVSHLNLGCCYADQPQRAEAHWKEAVRLQEKIARASGQPWDRYWLAVSSSNLAMLYRDAGRVAEADATYREVEPRLSELVREQPDNKEWAYGLVQTLRNWGAMLNTAGRGEEARERLTRGVEIMEKELTEDPQNPGVQDLLLGCLVADMNNCTLRQRPEEGEKDWKRALDLSARLNSWDDLCIGALWDARFGAHALAAARAEHLAGQKGISHEALYTLAKAYAVAAAAAQKDSRLPLAERGPAAERYAAAAMALLAGLGREGYFTTAERRTLLSKGDADLEPLRSRLDFQKLLADQEVLSSARK